MNSISQNISRIHESLSNKIDTEIQNLSSQKENNNSNPLQINNEIIELFKNLNELKAANPKIENARAWTKLKSKEKSIDLMAQSSTHDSTAYLKYLKTVKKCLQHVEILRTLVGDEPTKNSGQQVLTEKIIQYLEHEKRHCTDEKELQNRQDVINYFKKSQGECTGLSTLWAYGSRLMEEKPASQAQRDDLQFFNTVHQVLLNWDGKRDLSRKEKADIERFIGNIRLYQLPCFQLFREATKLQLDLSVTLEDTRRGFPSLCFEKDDIVCSKDFLIDRLEKIVQPQTLFFLGVRKKTAGHMIAIYKNASDGRLFLYDSNKSFVAKEAKNIADLGELIWEATDPSKFASAMAGMNPIDSKLRNCTFRIYNFPKDPQHTYPSEEEFCMNANELLGTFEKARFLQWVVLRDEMGKSLLNSLSDSEVIKILTDGVQSEIIKNDPDSYNNIKKALIAVSCLNIETKTSLLAKTILEGYSDVLTQLVSEEVLIPDDVEKLKKHSETDAVINSSLQGTPSSSMGENFQPKEEEGQIAITAQILRCIGNSSPNPQEINKLIESALDQKDHLTLEDGLLILSVKPGDSELAKEILTSIRAGELAEDSRKSLGYPLFLAIWANISSHNMETAKSILELMAKRFKVIPSKEHLQRYNNQEITDFVHDNFEKLHERKQEVMGRVAVMAVNKEIDAQAVSRISNEALKFRDILTLDDALLILTLNPGDSSLITNLLNQVDNKEVDEKQLKGLGFTLYLLIQRNIDNKTIDNAKLILKVLMDRFNIGLSIEQIKQLKNEEIAQFVHQNYRERYIQLGAASSMELDSVLQFIRLEQKNEIMSRVLSLAVNKSKDLHESAELTRKSLELIDILTLDDALHVLALNPGDSTLTEKVLSLIEAEQTSNKFSSSVGFSLFLAISANLSSQNQDTAKLILEILKQRFKLTPTTDHLQRYNNPEILDW